VCPETLRQFRNCSISLSKVPFRDAHEECAKQFFPLAERPRSLCYSIVYRLFPCPSVQRRQYLTVQRPLWPSLTDDDAKTPRTISSGSTDVPRDFPWYLLPPGPSDHVPQINFFMSLFFKDSFPYSRSRSHVPSCGTRAEQMDFSTRRFRVPLPKFPAF